MEIFKYKGWNFDGLNRIGKGGVNDIPLKNINQKKKSNHNSKAKKKIIRADFSGDIWGENKGKQKNF